MSETTNTKIGGAGFAEWKVPVWLKLLRWAIGVGIFSTLVTGIFLCIGWAWFIQKAISQSTEGFSPKTAIWIATVITLAFGLTLLIFRSKKFLRLFRIVKTEKGRWAYRGFPNTISFSMPISAAAIALITPIVFGVCILKTYPLFQRVEIIRYSTQAPQKEENLLPLYFWDYATWFNPQWLDKVDLVVPYEKGPPEKLLSKIYFQNPKTQEIELELHGRRPRSYSREQVLELFTVLNTPNAKTSFSYPRFWPLLLWLQTEAGLLSFSTQSFALHLMNIDQGSSNTTQAVGVPWISANATQAFRSAATGSSNSNQSPEQPNGRVFFWGPDGSVFQARCAKPCTMGRLLELIQFPDDPRGSFAARKEWTVATLKEFLSGPHAPKNLSKEEAVHWRSQHEKMLSLYLISLLTLDPRDPEAFFHLGKLSQNRQTVISAIRYGKDLGLENEKISELEKRLSTL